MNEYKSVTKYLNRKKQSSNIKRKFLVFASKILICIVLLLIFLIVLKKDENTNQIIYKYLYENNIDFASINNLYKKYFGDILPFQSIANEPVKQVFNEKITYTDASIYKNGVKLEVDNNYLIPILESGVVVFIGQKDDFNNTVIIQQVDGINVWYGNINNLNVNLYDYVSKGEFLGESIDNSLYLLFEKDGEYLDYKDYINKN